MKPHFYIVTHHSDFWVVTNKSGNLEVAIFVYRDSAELDFIEALLKNVARNLGLNTVVPTISMTEHIIQKGDTFSLVSPVTNTLYLGECEGDCLRDLINQEQLAGLEAFM